MTTRYENGRHGTTYPDMPWEPKGSFKAVADYDAADFAHAQEESHPGNTTCDRHHPDHAELEALHAILDGRSGSGGARAHAYGYAQNHRRAGAFRSRSLWPLRPDRFCRCADRLHAFGRTDLAGLLRTACSVGGRLYGAFWPKPLASSLNPVSVSGGSQSS
jgi:hypothetical protein